MFNATSESFDFEGDDTCSFEGTLLQSGECTDSKGAKYTITPDDVKQAYASLMKRDNLSNPLREIHDGQEVAKFLKYKLVDDSQGHVQILTKGVVHDPKKYYDRYSRGFKHLSPELTFHTDDATNKLIMIEIDGAAMSKSPGMNPETVITRRVNFSLDTPEKIEVNKTPEDTFDWKVPLTNLESKVDSITSAIKEMTAAKDTKVEQKMTEDPTPDMNQITELVTAKIREEIAQLKAEKAEATTPEPVVEEVNTPELDEKIIESIPKEFLETYTTSLAELEALKQENKAFKDEKERQAKQAYSEILEKCRGLGIENPEKFVASNNLNTEQKTAMLSAFAAEFVKKTPLNTSQSEPITNQGPDTTTADDTVEAAMQRLGIKKPSSKFMERAIETGLYDKSGKWVGDSTSGYA